PRALSPLPTRRSSDLGRLAGVEDEALAEHGVQGTLEQPHALGGVGDVPDEEPVVQAYEGGSVVVDTRRALQPPVRRVQGVGVVRSEEHTSELQSRENL